MTDAAGAPQPDRPAAPATDTVSPDTVPPEPAEPAAEAATVETIESAEPTTEDAAATDETPHPATDSAPVELAPAADTGAEAGTGLPALPDDAAVAAAVEALLLVVDAPASTEQLATALDQPVARVDAILHRLAATYTEQGSGIDLRRVGGGWRFFPRDRFAPFVEKLLLDGQRTRLTRAALETLAVVAYRQPVTRARVAAVRGVNVDGVIRTLLARGLVEEAGTDAETGGTLYRTTELFLERLGLSSLEDLPPIAPLLPEVDAIDDV